MKSNLLLDERPLIILPGLAKKIGLNESIIMQQVHYWINNPLNKNEREGRKWVYKTYDEWSEEFTFWSIRTIRRVIKNLEDNGLLISSTTYNKAGFDRTKWYTLDYERLSRLGVYENAYKEGVGVDSSTWSKRTDACVQNGHMPSGQIDHMQYHRLPIPQTTHRTNNIVELEEVGEKPQPRITNARKDVIEIFDHWREIMGRPRATLDIRRKKAIEKGLEAFSKGDLMIAIVGCSKTPHNMGDNERGEVYDGVHIIFKDADQIERFMRNAIRPPEKNRKLTSREESNKVARESSSAILNNLSERIQKRGGMDVLLNSATGNSLSPFEEFN